MTVPEAIDPALESLAVALSAALARAGLPDAEPGLERPKQAEHGDWATPLALSLAKQASLPPREIAEKLVAELDLPPAVASAEVAGPGFVNFKMAPEYFHSVVHEALRRGAEFGRVAKPANAERVNVEFVSANPTGPLHAGHGRWAAAGDAIAELFAAAGNEVVREYYVNDAGEQVRLLAESVIRVANGLELGDEHYRGDYIGELGEELVASVGAEGFAADADPDTLAPAAVELMLDHIRATLEGLEVHMDVWTSERELHDSGAIAATVASLREGGHTYEEDGALFLRTSDHGDDKDRVLLKSDGRPTYFAADCAYLKHKWDRGFDRLVYVLGADHHGYVGRLTAAAISVGIPEEALEIRIGQLVNLLRGGEPVKMSKRTGEFVTLDQVIGDVGPDVARYHFLRQSLDTTIDFDLEVVAQQSMENPVYYVQYAHARIASIVRVADDSGFDPGVVSEADLSLLVHPAEVELLRKLAELPHAVVEAADRRGPHRIARYAEELAGTFHRFYTECRVLIDDVELARARYWLAASARQVLANALSLLRVRAPDKM